MAQRRAGNLGTSLVEFGDIVGIPAEQADRRAYLMETDPFYCDVIVQRYEQSRGQKGVRT